MKKLYIIAIIISIFPGHILSQARLTPELKQRLQNKTDFYEIRSEVKNYYYQKRSKLSPEDTMQRRFINRQLKFWNRWFYDSESKLEPDGSIANWSKRMYEAENAIRADASEQAMNNDRAANSSWTLIGPTNVDVNDGIGRVLRLGFDPVNSQVFYAGAARGGLWKTSNGGTSWQSLSAYLPSLGVSGIEVNQDNPNTIYILSGEGDAWLSGGFTTKYGYVSFSNGVFKSTDGGSSWTKTAEFSPGIDTTQYVGFELRQDPTNSSVYIAATSEGVFRTGNGGGSWSTATFHDLDGFTIFPALNTIGCFDVEFKPGSGSIVYAGCWIFNYQFQSTRYAFFRSVNGGSLFSEVDLTSQIDVSQLIRFEIGVTPANPNLVYLLCGPGFVQDGDGSNDTFLGFLKSTNSGVSFTKIATAPDVFAYNPSIGPTYGNQCKYDMALAISPTNASMIFTGGLVVFRSTNGGVDFDGNTTYWTWEVGENIHPDIHYLQYNPLDGKLYATSDGGVFVTANNGGSWSSIFNGMSITQFYHSEPDNENNKLWGGTQDNGVLQQESGGTFSEFDSGDGFDVLTDNIVGNGNDSYWTTNGSAVTSGNFGNVDITPPDPNMAGRNFGTLEMHSTNEDYIYIGYTDAVWYSNDQGDSWVINGLNNVLAGGTPKGDWCIQACPSNASRLYAAGSGSIWRVDNINFNNAQTGTSTELRVSLFNAGFPGNSSGSVLKKVTDILVNPSTSAQVWVTASGFYPGKKVFYSANSGGSWSNITYNLPNIPANCLLRDSDGTIYVGMDAGVYYLPPGENNWKPYYNSLPRVPVTEMNLVLESSIPYIYASTFGRGIWKCPTFTGCAASINITSNLRGQRFYQASSSITSTSLVDGVSGTNVYFQSGNSITLSTGFEGKTGAEFTGFIQPCNTGPLPAGMEVPHSTRSDKSVEPIAAVIESIENKEEHKMITIDVRTNGNYSMQLYSADGQWIKEIQAAKDYTPGKYQLLISKSNFSEDAEYISLVEDEQVIHFQECK